jgi:hypothetical protein
VGVIGRSLKLLFDLSGRASTTFGIERDLIAAAARLEELGASAFIGWTPAPQTYDSIGKEFQKLEEAVRRLRAMGAIV